MPNPTLDQHSTDPDGADGLDAVLHRTARTMHAGATPDGDSAWPSVQRAGHRRRNRRRGLLAAAVVVAGIGARGAWPENTPVQVSTAATTPPGASDAPADETTTTVAGPVNSVVVPETVPDPGAPSAVGKVVAVGGWTFNVPADWTVQELSLHCSGFVEGWWIGPPTGKDPVQGLCTGSGLRTAQLGIGVAIFSETPVLNSGPPKAEDAPDGDAAPGEIGNQLTPDGVNTFLVWAESTEATSEADRARLVDAAASRVAPPAGHRGSNEPSPD